MPRRAFEALKRRRLDSKRFDHESFLIYFMGVELERLNQWTWESLREQREESPFEFFEFQVPRSGAFGWCFSPYMGTTTTRVYFP